MGNFQRGILLLRIETKFNLPCLRKDSSLAKGGHKSYGCRTVDRRARACYLDSPFFSKLWLLLYTLPPFLSLQGPHLSLFCSRHTERMCALSFFSLICIYCRLAALRKCPPNGHQSRSLSLSPNLTHTRELIRWVSSSGNSRSLSFFVFLVITFNQLAIT